MEAEEESAEAAEEEKPPEMTEEEKERYWIKKLQAIQNCSDFWKNNQVGFGPSPLD